jgi:hypothetical protein
LRRPPVTASLALLVLAGAIAARGDAVGVDSMRGGWRVAATPLAAASRLRTPGVQRARASVHRTAHSPLADESKAQFRLVAANALYRAHRRTAAHTTFMRAMQAADSAVSITRSLRSAAASRIEKHAYADAENARGAIETIDGETRTDRR